MLFNSVDFLFIFLPVVLVGYFASSRINRSLPLLWLVGTSLYFYADWKLEYLWIILASVAINFLLGAFVSAEARPLSARRIGLLLGIWLNLSVLAYYKYTGFVFDNLHTLGLASWKPDPIVLPLAISFFTFQQIAYLVDAYRGLCREYDFASYCLFVTFFPQLIAGPIVHHSEMIPQFHREAVARATARNFSIGLSILGIGLFKKVVVADGIAPWAGAVFSAADSGFHVSTAQAWTGALAYTFQLYFDFSGYSDMAVGVARLFGVVLPINFFSPYKSTSIIEFWRRWHITLSRFLREYLYFSLGGNRKGVARRYVNLLITMVLGGIWHGAGWNFLLWGTLHGTYLVANHGWRSISGSWTWPGRAQTPVAVASWLVTFLAVVVGWVFFRAETVGGALSLLESMFVLHAESATNVPGPTFHVATVLSILFGLCLSMPNTYELFRLHHASTDSEFAQADQAGIRLVWQPRLEWAIAIGVLSAVALLHLGNVSEFLYFQF